ncbi:MAG TPA: PQQ-binding-like beta-propeller repeat protein, partial [Acetobacteraceae bacterium]
DAKRNMILWGVGNAAPWPGDQHPGDNLFTSSVIGLDPESGAIKTHFQYHPNDSWDWDEIEAPMLIDLKQGSQQFDAVVHPARDGYLWTLKQGAKGLEFVSAKAFVGQNAFAKVDPENGRVTVDPAHKPRTGVTTEFCPSLWGGKDWPSASYSAQTGMVYIPANNNMCGRLEGVKTPYDAGQLWLGANPDKLDLYVTGDHIGELQAWNLSTGEKAWTVNFPSQLFASVLSTAGDLVFVGGTNDRMFRAFNAKTGEALWQHKTNSGIMAAPVSFEAGGTQYIAVQSGWGVDAQRIQDSLVKAKYGNLDADVPQGGVIWVYALKP